MFFKFCDRNPDPHLVTDKTSAICYDLKKSDEKNHVEVRLNQSRG